MALTTKAMQIRVKATTDASQNVTKNAIMKCKSSDKNNFRVETNNDNSDKRMLHLQSPRTCSCQGYILLLFCIHFKQYLTLVSYYGFD